jgi:hypothetical protein
VVPVGDVDGAADALARLNDEPELARELAEAARKAALQYDVSAVADAYERVYTAAETCSLNGIARMWAAGRALASGYFLDMRQR